MAWHVKPVKLFVSYVEVKMAYFSKKTKQRIIDDYLQQTGNNMYVPQEFIDWLADHPDHEAYHAFHGRDAELLNESKLDLARRFASGPRS